MIHRDLADWVSLLMKNPPARLGIGGRRICLVGRMR